MKNVTKSLFVLSVSLFFFNCSSSEVTPPDNNPTPTATKTTYDKDVKTLINNSCATSACHDAVSPQAGLPLTNYTQVKNAAQNGNLIARINSSSNPMPPSGQNSTVVAIIAKWKTDGYLEN
ncbi:conserved exported hypothetical protein [Tenacibaculum litopenaei]|jgi:hypothetical protein|uniref:hypothetical protein n=1 Tax=Tenacibaculum litopenaei TaxID=396016 RepID=UPI0038954189